MLRQSTAADCREIYNLICDMEATALDYGKFTSIYLQQLADANYYCLIYEESGKTCGMLNLRFEQQLHHTARIAEIMEFAVAPDCRCKGVGKIIFAEAVKIAKLKSPKRRAACSLKLPATGCATTPTAFTSAKACITFISNSPCRSTAIAVRRTGWGGKWRKLSSIPFSFRLCSYNIPFYIQVF